jgi:hypothetical protein
MLTPKIQVRSSERNTFLNLKGNKGIRDKGEKKDKAARR